MVPHSNSEESKPAVKEQRQEVVKRKHNRGALLRQDVADQFLLSSEVVNHLNQLLFTSPH